MVIKFLRTSLYLYLALPIVVFVILVVLMIHGPDFESEFLRGFYMGVLQDATTDYEQGVALGTYLGINIINILGGVLLLRAISKRSKSLLYWSAILIFIAAVGQLGNILLLLLTFAIATAFIPKATRDYFMKPSAEIQQTTL